MKKRKQKEKKTYHAPRASKVVRTADQAHRVHSSIIGAKRGVDVRQTFSGLGHRKRESPILDVLPIDGALVVRNINTLEGGSEAHGQY